MKTRIIITIAVALLFATPMVVADERPEFSCKIDASGRFLALERQGVTPNMAERLAIGPPRNQFVTVFEYLGDGKPLRKLYEMELLNPWPLATFLSRDGRFYVTLDEWSRAGTGPFSLVIYDLARKEHTAYAAKDLLGEEVFKSLPIHGFIPGYGWWTKAPGFSEDSSKFYPTAPDFCESDKVPFVVVDLPTRTARVEPIPPAGIKGYVELGDWVRNWTLSKETVATDTTVLPKRITTAATGGPEIELELAPSKLEYVPIRKDKPLPSDADARSSKEKP